jgi:nucleoside-diphosphate-sugar epimerase
LNKQVKRVVVTSSGLCICGYNWEDRTYSEKDWPNVEDMKMAYGKSKVLAEKAAWNFVEERKANNEDCFELAVVHPTLVLGPLLGPSTGASATRFLSVLNNQIEKIPNVYYPTCDVRDVAKAHLKAAFLPEANGNRHLIVSSNHFIPMKEWVDELRKEFEPKGYKFPTEVEQGEAKGQNARLDDTRMCSVLGIEPTSFSSTIIDMAYSFINFGLVEKKF